MARFIDELGTDGEFWKMVNEHFLEGVSCAKQTSTLTPPEL